MRCSLDEQWKELLSNETKLDVGDSILKQLGKKRTEGKLQGGGELVVFGMECRCPSRLCSCFWNSMLNCSIAIIYNSYLNEL